MERIYVVTADLPDDNYDFFWEHQLDEIIACFNRKTDRLNETESGYLHLDEFKEEDETPFEAMRNSFRVNALPFEEEISYFFPRDNKDTNNRLEKFLSDFEKWYAINRNTCKTY